MAVITAKTASVQPLVHRSALRAELEATRTSFRTLVERLSDQQWREKSPSTAWTVGEVLVHLTWALEQLPAEVSSARHGKGMFNYPAWFANPAGYWLTRWEARNATRQTVVHQYERAMVAVLASLDAVAESDWELGATFYGHGFYTIEGLFHTPAQHFAEHTAGM